MYGGNVKEDLTSNDQKWIPIQSIKRYLTHKKKIIHYTNPCHNKVVFKNYKVDTAVTCFGRNELRLESFLVSPRA